MCLRSPNEIDAKKTPLICTSIGKCSKILTPRIKSTIRMLVSASEQRMLEEVRGLGRQVMWSEKMRLCMRSIFFTCWLNEHEEGKTRAEEVQARFDRVIRGQKS